MNADLIHNTAMEYAKGRTQEALENAIRAALPLASAIAMRFSGRGVDRDDLKQVASMALVDALNSFDPERGLRFTTYVTPTMTGKVRNYIRDRGQLMRSPRGLREQGIQMDRANENLTMELRREPSVKELADHLGWPLEQVLEVQSMRERTTISSLDAPDEEGLFLSDRLGEEDQSFDRFESREDLKKALLILNEQERRLILLRFINRKTQSEAAKALGMTQMQVSRMERRVLAALRKEMVTT